MDNITTRIFLFNVIHCRGKNKELPNFLNRNPEDNILDIINIEYGRMLPPELTKKRCHEIRNFSN